MSVWDGSTAQRLTGTLQAVACLFQCSPDLFLLVVRQIRQVGELTEGLTVVIQTAREPTREFDQR